MLSSPFIIHTALAPSMLMGKTLTIKRSIAVVVDVLRATTTIAAALHNGANTMFPVVEIEEALVQRNKSRRETTLLCGERDGVKPSGFDLGNSPLEYTSDVVQGKTLIMTTTNGTRTIAATRNAPFQITAAFVNVDAVAAYLLALIADAHTFVLSDGSPRILSGVQIVCAGSDGTVGYEDLLCAGALVDTLAETLVGQLSPSRAAGIVLTDAARASRELYGAFPDTGEMLAAVATSTHGRRLTELGFADDIAFASCLNTCPVVPVVQANGYIVAEQEYSSKTAVKQ
jgi:2-phosphosulfolactate phosphatase